MVLAVVLLVAGIVLLIRGEAVAWLSLAVGFVVLERIYRLKNRSRAR